MAEYTRQPIDASNFFSKINHPSFLSTLGEYKCRKMFFNWSESFQWIFGYLVIYTSNYICYILSRVFLFHPQGTFFQIEDNIINNPNFRWKFTSLKYTLWKKLFESWIQILMKSSDSNHKSGFFKWKGLLIGKTSFESFLQMFRFFRDGHNHMIYVTNQGYNFTIFFMLRNYELHW